MKNNRIKWILFWIALGLVVLLAVGNVLRNSLPIYPAFSRSVDSVSEAREELSESERAQGLFVVDPAALGLQTQKVQLELDGRTRGSTPIGYYVSCREPALPKVYLSLSVSARDRDDTPTGEPYRGMPAYYSASSNEYWKLYDFAVKCNGFVYRLFASFPVSLPQEEAEAAEAQILDLFHRIADNIIDNSPDA